MISFDQIHEADMSFHVHSLKQMNGGVSALCSLDCFQNNGIIFIKNKKYYHSLLDKLKQGRSVENIGVIFQESFIKEINDSDKSKFLNQFRFYATVKSIDLAFSYFSKLFFNELNPNKGDLVDGRKTGSVRVHPTSHIADDVFLGDGVEISAHVILHTGCVILSKSKIGEQSILYPHVVVYQNVLIGKNCIIHANTTIGSDGFRFNYDQESHLKVWHFGGVIIEDSVEIGSNTSIDQGTFSPTIIGQGSKIDNQVHIAHNCRLGKGVIICGQSGLAGSVTLEDNVVLGGAVNVAPNVKIGKGAQIAGMSGVTGHVPEKAIYGGHPARPLNEWLRSSAFLRKASLKRNGKLKKN